MTAHTEPSGCRLTLARRVRPALSAVLVVLTATGLAGCGESVDAPTAVQQAAADGTTPAAGADSTSSELPIQAPAAGSPEESAAGSPEESAAGSPEESAAGSTEESPAVNADERPSSPATEARAPADEPEIQPRPAQDLTDEEISRTYSEDVEPGAPVTSTLCNLSREHLELLEGKVTAQGGIDPSNLRLALISLGDDLGVWEGITWHLPEAAPDIETAREVYAHWDYALALLDSGDSGGATAEIDIAATKIDTLPADPDVELGCDR